MEVNKANDPIRDQIDRIRRDDDMMGFERWRKIGQLVVENLKERGQYFYTEQGLFVFDNDWLRALSLIKDDLGLASLLNQRYGINQKEHGFGRVLADLQSHAYSKGRKISVRRLAHYDNKKKSLYVSRFDGHVYKLDGDSIEIVPNGTDDVFFFDDRPSWEAYEYIPNVPPGEFDRQLIDSVNFTDSTLSKTDQRRLLKLWVLAPFFGSIQPTKIILLLLGDHGSGKTSALRRIQKFIFGPKADLLSIEKDKQDGFVAAVTTDPLALFDNLDERISWLPYALSRLATGVTFTRRVLYTTNQKAEFPGVSWLGITARSVDFMANQPDLPDRTLVLEMERLNQKQPEGELVSDVLKNRNLMWSELLNELNAIVRYLKQDPKPIPVQFRMADFASFALQVATVWGCREEVEGIFKKLEQAQADLVFADEPINQVLDLWLRTAPNCGRSLDAGTLQREWNRIALTNGIGWRFVNGIGLARRLNSLLHALRQRFDIEVIPDLHLKQNLYRFWPKGHDQGAGTESGLIYADDAPEAAAVQMIDAPFAGVAG
jgi:hypothetical protein